MELQNLYRITRTRFPHLLKTLLLFLIAGYATAGSLPQGCSANTGCSSSTCLSKIDKAAATPPVSACPDDGGEAQGGVDVLSWNMFIAINWPADTSTCKANTGKSIMDVNADFDGKLLWETWLSDSDIFVSSGKPADWCSPSANGSRQLQLSKANPHIKQMIKNSALGDSILEAVDGVLTDQNGRFVRYEVLVNDVEYQYIVKHNLWNKAGQTAYTSKNTVNFTDGSIELKLAWKVLDQDEINSKTFYMTRGTVYNDAEGSKSPGKNPVTLGLVGFHLVYKDPKHGHLWATFEHVQNAPDSASAKGDFSFYNSNCKTADKCASNTQYAKKPYTELDKNGKPLNTPTQVVRVNPIDTNDHGVAALNSYYQGLLKGSVFANYQLVGTQWSVGFALNGKPAILANTTMETYNQKTSSCIVCHRNATTAGGGKPADFSFIMGDAQ